MYKTTNCPNIHFFSVPVLFNTLRSRIIRRCHNCKSQTKSLLDFKNLQSKTLYFRKFERSQFKISLCSQHNIIRSNIAMNNISLMHILQNHQYLKNPVSNCLFSIMFSFIPWSSKHVIGKVTLFTVLFNQVNIILFDKCFVYVNKIRMF